VRAAGMPLEVTFAPTSINIDHASRVIERARTLGAFRFNSGRLMRVGTAARLWSSLEPTADQYRQFRAVLEREAQIEAPMELCYSPFDLAEAMRHSVDDPPATLLVVPNGWVKVAAVLPHICADLRKATLAQAWQAYRDAWRDPEVIGAARGAVEDESRHAQGNRWRLHRRSMSESTEAR